MWGLIFAIKRYEFQSFWIFFYTDHDFSGTTIQKKQSQTYFFLSASTFRTNCWNFEENISSVSSFDELKDVEKFMTTNDLK